MRQIFGALLIISSVYLFLHYKKLPQKNQSEQMTQSVSDERVNEHLFLTHEQLQLQKEKIELMQKTKSKQEGSIYEVHEQNTTGVDISSDLRPGQLVQELGRDKKLDQINNPQREIHDELLELQKQEREAEKRKIQELKKLKGNQSLKIK